MPDGATPGGADEAGHNGQARRRTRAGATANPGRRGGEPNQGTSLVTNVAALGRRRANPNCHSQRRGPF